MNHDLTRNSVDDLLDRVAQRAPTPGGGSVAALAGALACALGRMVAAYSITKRTSEADRARVEAVAGKLRRADEMMRALVTRDAVVYEEMTAAAKARRDDASRQAVYDRAVTAAVAVPMEIAAVAAGALSTLSDFAPLASPYLLSDLGVAAVLAEATARAARYTVVVNLGEVADAEMGDRYRGDTDRIIERCATLRDSIEAAVSGHLEKDESERR